MQKLLFPIASAKTDSEPGKPLARPSKIDPAQHRILVPKDITLAVPWLRNRTKSWTECRARPSLAVPAIEILSPVSSQRLDTVRYSRFFTADPVQADASEPYMQLLRREANLWPVKIEAVGETRRLYVPDDLSKIGFLPAKGVVVVLFCFGNILELWTCDDWKRNVSECDLLERNQLDELLENLKARTRDLSEIE